MSPALREMGIFGERLEGELALFHAGVPAGSEGETGVVPSSALVSLGEERQVLLGPPG